LSGMDAIADSLRELLTDRPIIARCELLARTYAIVRSADLRSDEKEQLQKMVGKHIAPGIFANMMSGEPVIFSLPKIDTYTTLHGRIFHFLHTQRYSKQDFDSAYRRFLQSVPELRAMVRQNLADVLKDFMSDAGYELTMEALPDLAFEAGNRKIRARVFASVKSLDLSTCGLESNGDINGDMVVLIPSGEALEPFMQFFRVQGEAASEAGVQIWIANMEQGAIDPFIGYTTDLDIYEQFNNPRLAEMVRANWAIKS